MNILKKFHENTVREWVLLRMAASEFYFKQPYNIEEEYPIMTSIMGFSFIPICMIFGFLYARAIEPLERFVIPVIIIFFTLSFGTAYLIIRKSKNAPFVAETMREYNAMDLPARKKLYSFKLGFKLISIMVILPWTVTAISIAAICLLIPPP